MLSVRQFRSQSAVLLLCCISTSVARSSEDPKWIWAPSHATDAVPAGACYFRRTFVMDAPASGTLEIAADDTFEVYINGKRVGRGEQWEHLTRFDISEQLEPGSNTIAVKVVNREAGAAGLVARLTGKESKSAVKTLVTDATWKTSLNPLSLWQRNQYADGKWKPAQVLGPLGNTEPWIATSLRRVRDRAVASTSQLAQHPESPTSKVVQVSTAKAAGASQRRSNANLSPAKPLRRPLGIRLPWVAGIRRKLVGTPEDAAVDTESAGASRGARSTTPEDHEHGTARTPLDAGTSDRPRRPIRVADLFRPRRLQRGTVGSPLAESEPTLDPRARPPHKLPVPSLKNEAKLNDAQTARSNPPTEIEPQPTAQSRQFTVRTGFAVERLLRDSQTGSLISLTFNEYGQILAGQENGPLILIDDTNQDNIPDRVQTYCDQVKNCHGILALSREVFVVAEGPEGEGLYRLKDEDGDGTLENVASLLLFDASVSEHGPHGVVLGPDSNLYVVVGNHAKLKGRFATTSPRQHLYEGNLIPRYEDPGGHARGIRSPGGFVLRTDINGSKIELFASGLRNAYDLAFNADGQLFTYDSDMESDEGTSWYRPTCFYHVLPGAEFGWRSGWAKWPAYYHDSLPPVAETGRGSPTGIVFYQHDVYPAEYRDAAFLADWSKGRILVARLKEQGATYTSEPEVFLEGTPLNVTDLAVGPDGSLYFATGGRGTQGSVCRVVWKPEQVRRSAQYTGIQAALQAPQLHSGWGRQQVAAVAREIGPSWSAEIRAGATDVSVPTRQRVQALQIMQWVGPIPEADLLLTLSQDSATAVRRMAAYLLSDLEDERVPGRLIQLLQDRDAVVRRQASESLVRLGKSVSYKHVQPLLVSNDHAEVWAARRLLAQGDPTQWQADALATSDIRVFIQVATTLMVAAPTKQRALRVVDRARGFMAGFIGDKDFVDLLRVLQLAVLRGQLAAQDVPKLVSELSDEFPATHHVMNRELIRLLVRLQATSILDRYLEHLDTDLPSIERIHLATHLRFLKADWTTTQKLSLFRHLQAPQHVGNSVPGYLQNVVLDLGRNLVKEEAAYVLQHGPEHPNAALAVVLRMPKELSPEQVGGLAELDRSLTATDEATRRLSVAIIAMLAEDGQPASMQLLREAYDRDPQRRMEITIGLAEQPSGENWAYLLRSLSLLEGQLAREILVKLRAVDRAPRDAEPYRQVIMIGYRLGDNGGEDAVRLLEYWRGFAATDETPSWNEALVAWQNWFVKAYPNATVPKLQVGSADSKWDYDALLKHLRGDGLLYASSERGKAVFAKADCAKCHRHGNTGEAMGPDLSTIGKRFLTKEVLDSIIYPSHVISDQYMAKTIVTTQGQAYTGIVGSGGPDDLLVLQANGEKVRVPRADVDETVRSNVSAMPEGLLNTLSLDEIADLIAFLKETSPEQTTRRP